MFSLLSSHILDLFDNSALFHLQKIYFYYLLSINMFCLSVPSVFQSFIFEIIIMYNISMDHYDKFLLQEGKHITRFNLLHNRFTSHQLQRTSNFTLVHSSCLFHFFFPSLSKPLVNKLISHCL